MEWVFLAAIGAGAFYIWHRVHTADQRKSQLPIYYGAPAWPTMGPQIVPDIGLPPGIEQAATYYGVSSTLLEGFLK